MERWGRSCGGLLSADAIAKAVEVLDYQRGFEDEVAANRARLQRHPTAQLMGVHGPSNGKPNSGGHETSFRSFIGTIGNGSG
jgi:hypothetical protein